MPKVCLHCTSARPTKGGLCDVCRESLNPLMDPTTATDLLLALAPKLDEDVLMALRFLYYVKAKPVVPDAKYDEAEKEYTDREEVEDSPVMYPGSDKASDYPDHIKALAFYLSLLGWEAGQRAGAKPEMPTGQNGGPLPQLSKTQEQGSLF
jgi:hypothetical protein